MAVEITMIARIVAGPAFDGRPFRFVSGPAAPLRRWQILRCCILRSVK